MYFLRSATLGIFMNFPSFKRKHCFLSPTMPHQKFWDQQHLVEIIKNGLWTSNVLSRVTKHSRKRKARNLIKISRCWVLNGECSLPRKLTSYLQMFFSEKGVSECSFIKLPPAPLLPQMLLKMLWIRSSQKNKDTQKIGRDKICKTWQHSIPTGLGSIFSARLSCSMKVWFTAFPFRKGLHGAPVCHVLYSTFKERERESSKLRRCDAWRISNSYWDDDHPLALKNFLGGAPGGG